MNYLEIFATGIKEYGDLVTDSLGTFHLSGIRIPQLQDKGTDVNSRHAASLDFLNSNYVGKQILVHQEKGQNAQVFLQDGTNLALEILKSGYASVDLSSSEKSRILPYVNAFNQAVNQGKGNWNKANK